MRIGVLVNPSAGHGQKARAVISRLEESWQGHELLAMAGPSAPSFTRATLLPEPDGGYVEKLFGSVRTLLDAGAQMIVTLGGDGTAAYATEALGDARRTVPLLGIGLGAVLGYAIVRTLEQPFIQFDRSVSVSASLIGMGLTVLFTVIVNVVALRKVKHLKLTDVA